jgi:hypothetical protein
MCAWEIILSKHVLSMSLLSQKVLRRCIETVLSCKRVLPHVLSVAKSCLLDAHSHSNCAR